MNTQDAFLIFFRLLPTLTRTELANCAPGGCVLGKTRYLSRSRFPTMQLHAHIKEGVLWECTDVIRFLRNAPQSVSQKAFAGYEVRTQKQIAIFYWIMSIIFLPFPARQKESNKTHFNTYQHSKLPRFLSNKDTTAILVSEQTKLIHASMCKTVLIGEILRFWFFCPCCMCAQSSWR